MIQITSVTAQLFIYFILLFYSILFYWVLDGSWPPRRALKSFNAQLALHYPLHIIFHYIILYYIILYIMF